MMDVIARIGDTLERMPRAPALEFRGHWFDWEVIGQFAARLKPLLPQEADCHIALLARNRPAHVAALLALLAIRCRVVMVYAFQPAEQIAAEIRELGVSAVIFDREDQSQALIEALQASGAGGIVIDPLLEEPPRVVVACRSSLRSKAETGQAVIEMLTSGTTGKPKRIPITTDTISRATADMVRAGADSTAPEIVAFPIGNISGLYYLIPACANVKPLVLLEKFSLSEWLAAVKRHRPAYCALPPAAVRMMLDMRDIESGTFDGLAALGVGAAPLAPDVQEEFERRFGLPILVGYGATEFCGVVAAWTLEDHQSFAAAKRGSVGRARPGVALRIVEAASGMPAAPGETGVLEARVDRIGPDWIRTTDLASLDADGFLFLHGRADDIINRGGFKVQPGKVEAVLARHPAVGEAVVVGLNDERLGEVPVAVIEPRQGGVQPDPDDLRAFAHKHLRAPEVPARFVVVDALPRTPSMKARRVEVKEMVKHLGVADGSTGGPNHATHNV